MTIRSSAITDPTSVEARAVGIPSSRAWPYGASTEPAVRRALVDWARPRRLRLSQAVHPCVHWLLRGRSCTMCGPCHRGDRPRWADHVTGWNRDGRPTVLVAQPYPDGPDGDGRDLIEASLDTIRELGCTVTLATAGWYGHGTRWVQIEHPGRPLVAPPDRPRAPLLNLTGGAAR